MWEVAQNDEYASDEVLLSMVTLAAHGNGEIPHVPNLKRSWTTSVLSTAHNIDYYGGMETSWAHINALQLLVFRRGGLHMIKLKAAAIAIQLYDAFTSWRLFHRPIFPLLQPTSYFMSLRSHTPDASATALSNQMTSGFSSLPLSTDHLPLQTLLQAVTHTATLSADLDQWQRKTADAPDYLHVQFTRWCILHDLLSLPDLSDTLNPSLILHLTTNINNITDTYDDNLNLLYSLIRLSTFAYFLFTLVPIPEAGQLPAKLSEKFRFVLDI
jgi:hypothetical protein